MRKIAPVLFTVLAVSSGFASGDTDTLIELVGKAMYMSQAEAKDHTVNVVERIRWSAQKGGNLCFRS